MATRLVALALLGLHGGAEALSLAPADQSIVGAGARWESRSHPALLARPAACAWPISDAPA